MLISFLLTPQAFGVDAIKSKASRQAAELVFKDILDAGLIVDYCGRPTISEIEREIEQLRPELKQRLMILLEELKKRRKMVVATPADNQRRTREMLIESLRPDIAIASPKEHARIKGVPETVSVEDYLDSSGQCPARC